MYVPAVFAQTDRSLLHDFIERYSFGILVSQVDGDPFATHLPFLLERDSGEQGTLVTHLARANPHWRHLDGQTALSIFSGPHAYISPTWYAATEVVPTWNYAAVHVYAKVQVIHDPAELLQIVRKSVALFEQGMPRPWTLDGLDEFVSRLLPQIVGLRLVIQRIEGKWKMNQNHPVERRENVVRALQEGGDEMSLAVAKMVAETVQTGR